MNIGVDIMGDANRDGKVDIRDAIAVIRRAAGFKVNVDETQADMNQDGYANAADAVAIAKSVVGR